MRFLPFICLLFFSGCLSRGPLIESRLPRGSSEPVMPSIPFEDIDADNDSSIDELEYSKISRQTNTKDPIWGLIFILTAVITCISASSFMLRPKK